jgi:hypothetical protein
MRSNLRGTWLRCATALATMAVGTAAAVAVSGAPAYAATPRCNATELIRNINVSAIVYFDMPVYRSGGSATVLCTMSFGDNGDDVNQLQWTLNYCYSEHLSLDSDFGRLTKEALVRAQGREHIKADGIYGPQTALALLHPQVPTGGCGHL